MAVPGPQDDDEAIALERTQLDQESGTSSSRRKRSTGWGEKELARESVRARLKLETMPPMNVGRYVLLRTLGSGGMGVVMAAHDPQLDREVAIKVLHPPKSGGATSERAVARLMREARAIAKVSHPNVVHVYDTGVHDGHFFVVMELVRGGSLNRWMVEPHDWIEVVDMMLAAGRGLAAAHAAGVAHRDFKPANVLVGTDGRPRVVDFGLARSLEDTSAEESIEPEPPPQIDPTSLLVTATGAVMGTPAYMAPEQFVGAEADARTDQFAFCITLFEALLGQRPFAGATFGQLYESVLHDGLRFPATAERLPVAVREILARGLRRNRNERFSDMLALLQALERAVLPFRTGEQRPDPEEGPVAVDRELDPHLHAYLEGLPGGVESHPGCTTRSTRLRWVLAHHPLPAEAALPDAVKATVADLDERPWIPEVHERAVLATVRDRCMDPGVEGDDAWIDLLRSVWRAALSVSFFGFSVPSTQSSRLLAAALRSWTDVHRGTTIDTERTGDGFAVLSVEHPTGLLGALGRQELLVAVQTAMSFVGVRYTDTRVLDEAADVFRFELRWA